MRKILITGASSGFGYLTVNNLLKEGHSVAGTMRSTAGKNEAVAKELKEKGVHVIELDVTSEESVNNGVNEAIDKLGGLDVVINNAGVGVLGMQEHFTADDMMRVFNVNVFGVQRVLRAAIPHLRKQGHGTLIYISSLLGRMSLPFYGPYNATKWALEALAENYRTELSTFGIENCIVEPGGFATNFMDSLIMPSDSSRNEAYGEFMNVPKAMFEGFEEALANNPAQDPQIVADAVSNILKKPYGEKPFRTTVDHMGMGDAISGYNQKLDEVTHGIYSAFQIDGMLSLKN